MKVALIGGSFNPPTKMHGKMGAEILRLKLVDEVWYIPSNRHPFADIQASKSRRAPYDVRCDLVAALIQDMAASNPETNGRLRLCVVERDMEGECYTKNVVERLRALYRDIDFLWVTGTDCVADFPKWKYIDWVLENVPLIVYPRAGYPYTGNLGPKHFIIPETAVYTEAVSSTQVRKGSEDLLTPEVCRYWRDVRKLSA